ncbi:Metallo-dependent phosphatase-like protein [Crassisporium funariophilum]|nr:Metallo-dependent phosphatase-like protein [Crassisporium funariophilum]
MHSLNQGQNHPCNWLVRWTYSYLIFRVENMDPIQGMSMESGIVAVAGRRRCTCTSSRFFASSVHQGDLSKKSTCIVLWKLPTRLSTSLLPSTEGATSWSPSRIYQTMKSSFVQSVILIGVALLLETAQAIPLVQQPVPESEQRDLNPYPGKPRLTFKPDGTFKMSVFSDLHFGENPWDDWGPQQDVNSLALMRTVLGDEKPDYVVINGDLITGENTFKENATSLVDEIMGPINEAKVPFSSTHGNHDNQANITHLAEILREQKVAPMSYTRLAPNGVGGTEGPGNYWVPIYSKAQDRAPILILWFFDSRGGFSPNPNSVPVADWVDASVAHWIQSETQAMEKAWGPADSRAALAFVHIPPHAIQAVQATLDANKNPGLNADVLGDGSVQDSASVGNDGPFWNALNANIKNLHAIVSGHDHGNEWCAREPTKDVIFCFDKHSGYGGYGDSSWGQGVRNFVFHTPDPKASVQTWIRLEKGETRARVVLDNNYGRS